MVFPEEQNSKNQNGIRYNYKKIGALKAPLFMFVVFLETRIHIVICMSKMD